VPERLKSAVRQHIQEMLEQGIIRPSKSEMVSPLVVILKGKTMEDGLRLAVNYRFINSHTVVDPYPVPDINEIIQRVGKSRWISTFDSTSAYWQCKVSETDQALTAFVCDEGVFEFTRTPYGMVNSGSTFIRMVKQVLEPIHHFAEAYVDDMICHTADQWKQHLEQVDQFLQRIEDAKLTLRLGKCRFGLPETKFCGKIIGSGTKRPDPEKVESIQQLKPATTKKEVRQLLGLFSYFRESIPHFADLAKPLTDLTSKKVPNKVPWSGIHSKALAQLKAALCKATQERLYIADFDKSFTLSVDASDYAVAGILSQTGDHGIECPLAFFSNKLTATQRNWATIEKEAYAVLASLKRFRNLVWGSVIQVYSDHNPLTYLAEASGKSAKLTRWFLALQDYQIDFHYRAGSQNKAADCLSRPGTGEE
jgi:hypothetical protein